MIENYSVITGESHSYHGALVELTKEVRTLMEHGWQPLGGVLYVGRHEYRGLTKCIFAQAIVKVAQGVDNKGETLYNGDKLYDAT